MNDTRNTILAVVLSGLILVAWQFLYVAPQEKRRVEQTPQTQTVNPPAQSGTTNAPAPGAASAPPAAPQVNASTPAATTAPTQTREAAVAASPRIKIDTPSLFGSVSLKGGRIDDLALKHYRETVDATSPAIVLLSPSG